VTICLVNQEREELLKEEKEENKSEPEKAEGEDGEKEEKAKEDKGKQKLRQLHTHRYGEPEIPESAFWKKIIAYQQKLLVRCSRVNIVIDICETITIQA